MINKNIKYEIFLLINENLFLKNKITEKMYKEVKESLLKLSVSS